MKQNWTIAYILLALPCCGAEKIDDGLRQAVAKILYRVKASGTGVYRSDNPAQHLGIEFDAAGTRLQHPEGRVSAHLAGYGYGEHLRTPAPASPVVTGSKVEYRRGDLIEWYKNEAGGLEQSFTLTRRPGIAQDGEPLVIALQLDGALQPSLSPEGDAVLVGSALRYAGVHSWDTRGRAIPSRLEVREHEIRIVVDDRDAEYPLVVDPTWVQQQKLTEPGGSSIDGFGISVAVDGDTAVIGAPGKTIGPNTGQGAAFVFVRGGSPPVWTLQQQLTAADGASNDHFGSSVSVSGDTVVVGAYGVGGVDSLGNGRGAAYVFVRSGSPPVWSQQQELTAADGMARDDFGFSVSVNGNTVAVGAPPLMGFSINFSLPPDGKVYVFVRGVTTPPWTQQQELTVAGGTGLGRSVAVSGDTILAGAGYLYTGIMDASNIRNAAYLFVRGATAPPWTLQQTLTGADDSDFGWSVALDGGTAVIGAPGEHFSFNHPIPPRGAYAYVRGATTPPWTQQQFLTPPSDSNGFGWSVAVSGNTAVVGENMGTAAYVFARGGSVWSPQQELAGPATMPTEAFGTSVSISGNTIFVGAPPAQTNAPGAVYVFVTSAQSGPLAVQVLPGTGSGFGRQVFTALYADPNGASDLQVVYLAIGTSPGAPHTCFAAYVQFTNSLYLFNDTNTATLGPITPGSTTTVSNSQCTLSGGGEGGGGTVASFGNSLIVPFSITFPQSGFGGAKNIYGLAQSYSGANSNWQLLGTWTVPTPGPPNAVSVTPNSGSGLGPQTFTATYTDPAGATDIQVVYLQIGPGCFAAYIQGSNSLYLFNDTNSAILGPIIPGSNSTVSNSQCTLSGNGGTPTALGTNLIVPFSVTFAPTYTGLKNILGYAQNYSGATTGFQMLGTWTPAAGGTLTAVSVSPVNGSGFGPQTFNAVYTDSNGAADIQATYLDFGPTLFAKNSCIVVYVTGNHTLYLFDDNNSALGPITAGTNSTLSNSQCTLSGSGGVATPSGNNLTVPFNVTFTAAFAAQQTVFGLAQSYSGTQSPWANLGSWTP